MHTEMSETSKKALLRELEEATTEVARLRSQNARAVGLENRLAMALQEKDDLKQELDSATQRARMTESRVISYREKCSELLALHQWLSRMLKCVSSQAASAGKPAA